MSVCSDRDPLLRTVSRFVVLNASIPLDATTLRRALWSAAGTGHALPVADMRRDTGRLWGGGVGRPAPGQQLAGLYQLASFIAGNAPGLSMSVRYVRGLCRHPTQPRRR